MKSYYSILLLFLCFIGSSCSSNDTVDKKPKLEATEITPPKNFPYTFAEKPNTGKDIYIPKELKSNNFNLNTSKWSYQRSASSDNVILFWENSFGQYPSKVSNTNLRVKIDELLTMAEEFYSYYRDTMKFVIKGESQSDKYRMIIMLIYQEEWLATGAGYDNEIGALWINPTTTLYPAVIAHEFGHSFQYQVACDGNYGFRDQNFVGSFWEQCAQYMSWQQNNTSFTQELPYSLKNIHKNFSHEDIRYQSFYLMEYWKEKHGKAFLGKLWREAISPEHPIETYKRITQINQDELNDEIFKYACKNITWNYPLGHFNSDFITSLPFSEQKEYKHTTKLNLVENDYYQIDENQIPQNYGYNAIELSIPNPETIVSVNFTGLDGGYVSIEGWRYGFVVVKEDSTSFYGIMKTEKEGIATITIPEGAKELWLIVTGAPTEHKNHIWDDDSSNDENFPYKVKFSNTVPK